MSDNKFLDNELHLAVRVGDLETTRKALENGFNPNEIGLFEWSSVHEASYNGDTEILLILLEYGGNCNEKDLLNGSTPLHYAAAEGYPHCLELLLSKGGNAYIENGKGQTAPRLTRHKGCKEVFTKFGFDVATAVHFEDQSLNEEPINTGEKLSTKKRLSQPTFPGTYSKSTLSDDGCESGFGSKASGADAGAISPFGSLTSFGSSIISSGDENAGYISMGFQYNSKTTRLKICITEIVLTCLLPLEDSGILLFVAGRIVGGNTAKLHASNLCIKAKSEEFKLHSGNDQENSIKENNRSVDTFWQSDIAHIKFKSSLTVEFSNVFNDSVRECNIQVSVCTHRKRLLKSNSRGLPIATVQMPLKHAVKRLLKETYDLQLCHAQNITRHSHRFEQDPSEVLINGSSEKSDSVISIHRNWNSSLQLEETERSASDSDLKLISSHDNFESPRSSCLDIAESASLDDSILEEVTSHSAPSSPQVAIKLALDSKAILDSVSAGGRTRASHKLLVKRWDCKKTDVTDWCMKNRESGSRLMRDGRPRSVQR